MKIQRTPVEKMGAEISLTAEEVEKLVEELNTVEFWGEIQPLLHDFWNQLR